MPTFDILRRETDVRSFKQGAAIFEVGEPGDCMFAVVDGAVEIVLAGVVIERVNPGSLFGEMALIDGMPRSATAIAATDCIVAAINEKRFLRLVEITPKFALQVMQVITQRLRRTR
jgi:CRP/FNR family transcriptional regulator, cyclic AMP receptor protein